MGGCNAIGTEHGRYGLSCIQKLWSGQAMLSLYGMLECKLCCEIFIAAERGSYLVCGRLCSEQSSVSALLVYLVGVNRLKCMLRVLWCA